jgi:hypothetical protein
MDVRITRTCWLLCLALGTGCWPGPEVGEARDPLEGVGVPGSDGGRAPPGVVGFSQLQDTLFTPSCASSYCHKGLPPPMAPMSLEEGASYAQLVNQPSVQAGGVKRVVPGNPAQSYLVMKLKSLAGSVGGTATRMPLNKPPLDPARIAEVEAWIARGAPND